MTEVRHGVWVTWRLQARGDRCRWASYRIRLAPLLCRSNPLMLMGMTSTTGVRPKRFRLRGMAYFPAAFLAIAALAFCAPAADGREVAIPAVIGLVVAAAGLVLLTGVSRLVTDEDGLDVRFFGLRSRSIRWDEVVAATLGVSFPSLAYGIWLADAEGRRVRLHFGYWDDEERLLSLVAPRILDVGPDMDAEAAEFLGRLTHTDPRPGMLRRIPWLERRTDLQAGKSEGNGTTRVVASIGYGIFFIIGVAGMAQRGASPIAAAAAFGAGLAVSVLYPWDLNRPAWVAGSVAAIAILPLAIYFVCGPAAGAYLLGLFGGLLAVRILLKRRPEGSDRFGSR